MDIVGCPVSRLAEQSLRRFSVHILGNYCWKYETVTSRDDLGLRLSFGQFAARFVRSHVYTLNPMCVPQMETRPLDF